ncbi:hydantoinase/oxoprolinase family protein [Saliphagus sp. GCM10025334]
MTVIVGVDTGGTFTDSAVVDQDDGSRITGKASTTPSDPSKGVLNSLRNAADNADRPLDELLADAEVFFHGTTLTTNTVLERTGSSVGLITTRGQRDAVHIGRITTRTEGLTHSEVKHFAQHEKPEPIVPKHLIREVDERVDYKGAEIVELDETQVRDAVADLADRVDAIAVSLLWSFRNAEHERRVAEIAREVAPETPVFVSGEIAPKLGEYERAITTVVNGYTAPVMASYTDTLVERLEDGGLDCAVYMMQSTGGVLPIADADEQAVSTIGSGPTGGISGSRFIGRKTGYENVICTDVGGTSFDVGLVIDGELQTSPTMNVQKYTLFQPAVDVESIGSGGGSIAWIDDAGAIHVGPKSSGADPGPACYGRGGTEPTVTDADLLLGYLDPEYFLGGRQDLDVDAARSAMAERVAEPLDMTVDDAAAGVFEIVNAAMSDLLREVTIERGYDPRNFSIFAYGGAGPLHAPFYGEELGAESIVVPLGDTASVFSAFGISASDLMYVEELSEPATEPFDPDRLAATFESLESRIRDRFDREGLDESDVSLVREADLQYAEQVHQVSVGVPAGDLSEADATDLVARFEDEYESLYGGGAAYSEAEVQLINQRVLATATTVDPTMRTDDRGARADGAFWKTREVYWPSESSFVETDIHDGEKLGQGDDIEGPAVVQLPDTTIPVRPHQQATVDRYGNVVLTAGGER